MRARSAIGWHLRLVLLRLASTSLGDPALLVLFDPRPVIVLEAVGALALFLVHLPLVALETNLVLAVARIEVFLGLLQADFAHLANVGPPLAPVCIRVSSLSMEILGGCLMLPTAPFFILGSFWSVL